ncbi:unnamed protein product, partial [Didymodactylos carnosus]
IIFLYCSAINCGSPGQLENGYTSGERFDYPNMIAFFCSEGFELIGDGTARAVSICNENGIWTPSIPRCERRSCGPSPVVNNTYMLINNKEGSLANVMFNESIEYSCMHGYQLYGHTTLTCDLTGNWNHNPPICKQCKLYLLTNYTNIKFAKLSVPHHERVSYSCNDNFSVPQTNVSIICINGHLSDRPTCTRSASCKEHPPAIWNGRAVFRSTYHGSVARYRCFPGYRIENNYHKLTCHHGKWTPSRPPRCLPKAGLHSIHIDL